MGEELNPHLRGSKAPAQDTLKSPRPGEGGTTPSAHQPGVCEAHAACLRKPCGLILVRHDEW